MKNSLQIEITNSKGKLLRKSARPTSAVKYLDGRKQLVTYTVKMVENGTPVTMTGQEFFDKYKATLPITPVVISEPTA